MIKIDLILIFNLKSTFEQQFYRHIILSLTLYIIQRKVIDSDDTYLHNYKIFQFGFQLILLVTLKCSSLFGCDFTHPHYPHLHHD